MTFFDSAEIGDPMNGKPAFNGERPLAERLPEARNVAAPDVLLSNIESACRRRLPQIPKLPSHRIELVICAGGPSLKRGIAEVRQRALRGAHVVAINAASGYLLDNGIVPNGVVLLDPQEVLASQFRADRRVTYLVASQCHPAVFDKLAGHQILLWHAQDCGAELETIKRYYRDPVIIGGGTTAALRSIGIYYAMGFRILQIYGLDGSFEADERGDCAHHAYAQPEDDMPECIVIRPEWSDKEFLTRHDYARQADEFMDVLKTHHIAWRSGLADRLSVAVHGDGLIPTIWRKRRYELS